MNQFEQDLNRELQVISLSQEKKQQIATKAKAKKYSQKANALAILICTHGFYGSII